MFGLIIEYLILYHLYINFFDINDLNICIVTSFVMSWYPSR